MSMFKHAVVIGGSMAGMCTAQVVSEFADSVTIIERDRIAGDARPRKGVPQGTQPHAMLLKGLENFETLFPGYKQALQDAGGVRLNFGNEVAFNLGGRWRRSFESSLFTIAAGRPLMEQTVRALLARNSKVTTIEGVEVIGLTATATAVRVTGVTLRDRDTQAQRRLEADLVIDASGRGSHAVTWLAALGIAEPKELTVTANPGYANRVYQNLPTTGARAHFVVPSAPNQTRGMLIMPISPTETLVTLLGMNGDYPPTDEAAWDAFIRSINQPELQAFIDRGTPVSGIAGYRRCENRLRCYHLAPRHLDNFLLIGDAVYAFNPVYGQGMTVASSGALMLRKVLRAWSGRADTHGMARDFQRRLWSVISPAWMMATGEDRRWPAASGGATPALPMRLMQAYFNRVIAASVDDIVVAEGFNHVQNMLRGPESLLTPGMLWRVLRWSPPNASSPRPAATPATVRA